MLSTAALLCTGIKSKTELHSKKPSQRWIKFGINYNKFTMSKQSDLETRLAKSWYIVTVPLLDYPLLHIYW